MDTLIHFKQKGNKRTLAIEGEFFTHKEVLPMLAESGMLPDDNRFMLTYEQTKTKEDKND